ncbi:MAG: hypothetical protein ACRC7N_17155 [Clostridium sp.]
MNVEFDLNEKLVFENNLCRLYNNNNCLSLTKYLRKDNGMIGAKGRKGWSILIGEIKESGDREYLVFNDKGDIVASNPSYEEMCYKIDVLKLTQESKGKNE